MCLRRRAEGVAGPQSQALGPPPCPGRRRLPAGGARLRRRLAPLRARRSPGPYSDVLCPPAPHPQRHARSTAERSVLGRWLACPGRAPLPPAEPGSAAASRRCGHVALRARTGRTVPSGAAPAATRQGTAERSLEEQVVWRALAGGGPAAVSPLRARSSPGPYPDVLCPPGSHPSDEPATRCALRRGVCRCPLRPPALSDTPGHGGALAGAAGGWRALGGGSRRAEPGSAAASRRCGARLRRRRLAPLRARRSPGPYWTYCALRRRTCSDAPGHGGALGCWSR